ncbi:MAG: spore germination protein [Syntrophomonadaceae bacterium]|jgi:hypothetical protein
MRYLKNKNPDDKIVYEEISKNLAVNQERLSFLLDSCSDVVLKEFIFGRNPGTNCLLLYFDGLVNRQEVEDNILRPMLLEINMMEDNAPDTSDPTALVSKVQKQILAMAETKTLTTLQEVCYHISCGDTVLLMDGVDQGIATGTRSWQSRSIETPENEAVIQGPKEGFAETLRFNTALLRRRLRSANFKIESFKIGRITKTDVILGYIKDIASEDLIKEVRTRLSKIDIDGILDTGYLEEFIADARYSVFSQVEYTEKPDRVCGHLLDGRVCLMVDGSPMALIIPTSFPQFLISGEDYYQRFIPSSLFRIMRFVAFGIALLLPSLYVALITYHQEMIPSSLYLTIAASREGVPFPALVEAFILELTFELLREAGLRLPRAIGPAVSIVGALIIGDAAVQAGLVSTPMVVVIAFTGIASFVNASYNAGTIIRILRFGILLLAGTLGFFGIIVGLLFIFIRMASLSSFGQPYLAPLAPFNRAQVSDVLIRRPWYTNYFRPYRDGMKNQQRQGNKGDGS